MTTPKEEEEELKAEKFLDEEGSLGLVADKSNLASSTATTSTEQLEEAYGEFEVAPKKSRLHSNKRHDQGSLVYSMTSRGNSNNSAPWPSMDSAQWSSSSLMGSFMGSSWYFQQPNVPTGITMPGLVGSPSPSPGDEQTAPKNPSSTKSDPLTAGNENAGPSTNNPNEVNYQLPPHLSYWIPTGPQREMSEITIQQDMTMLGYPPYYYGGYAPPPLANNPNYPPGGSPSNNDPNANNPSSKQSKQSNPKKPPPPKEEEYKVYSTRWIMLLYMSLLNLLSDWTCYSVAPIALLTIQAFGDVDPESLVTVFLTANAVASAAEPAILGRLGLRRTVLLGAMLLMAGSIVKSGGLIVGGGGSRSLGDLEEEEADETWRLYVGFFLVGLSQPLYQCTPALLSASWFPENERTMATGVALNSNQLGIGCAFVFGTILVDTEEDIVPYFGLLSIISTITFVGAALQFDDAPPTPPSDTARVIKGSLEIKIPDWMKAFGGNGNDTIDGEKKEKATEAPAPASTEEPTECAIGNIAEVEKEIMSSLIAAAPSPAPGEDPVGSPAADDNNNKNNADGNDNNDDENLAAANAPMPLSYQMPQGGYPYPPPGAVHPLLAHPHPLQQPPPYMMPPGYYYPPPPGPYGYPAGPPPAPGTKQSENVPSFYHGYDQYGHYHNALLETTGYYEDYSETYEGVEPVMTQLGHHLDVDVRDDQIVQQFKACFSRPGFAHCVVAFTTSGIVINTLSTFMDYLVTLEGAGKEYVGIVGGTFQLLIMAASLVFGGWTDHSRKYYFMILFMLITGAFSLAVCNVNLDSDAGGDLRLNLLIVAVLTGPLQPISTELGVEVVYPLSENTVLVIQQLFSNLLSAAFIPVFKLLRDVGTAPKEEDVKSMFEVPQYTFSFYMLIIIHACSTLFFATFNGKYLRYEAELEKKAKKEEAEQERLVSMHEGGYGSVDIN